ncbi:hypothetical protein ACGC1H_000191 [Rhizoctonia solani]
MRLPAKAVGGLLGLPSRLVRILWLPCTETNLAPGMFNDYLLYAQLPLRKYSVNDLLDHYCLSYSFDPMSSQLTHKLEASSDNPGNKTTRPNTQANTRLSSLSLFYLHSG